MTYIAEKSTVQTSAQERQLITIEFAPKIHPDETEYSYPQPQFVFGEQVTRITGTSLTPLIICGMELVESKTNSGQLLNQPSWKYLVSNGQQKTWFFESALTRYSTRRLFLKDTAAHMGMKLHTQNATDCSQCPHFQDFSDRGRGWCHLFEQSAKTHHLRTNDCDTFADCDPLDAPRPSFAIESIVKVIDPTEHHNEWATFTVIGRKYNHQLYRNTESYLSETSWYYWLINHSYEPNYGEHFWVAENEICLFDESHLISTQDIF